MNHTLSILNGPSFSVKRDENSYSTKDKNVYETLFNHQYSFLTIYDEEGFLVSTISSYKLENEENIDDSYTFSISEVSWEEKRESQINSKFDYISLVTDISFDDESMVMPLALEGEPDGTAHSPKYTTLLRYFKTGLWSETKMRAAVSKHWITMLEFEQITGLKY